MKIVLILYYSNITHLPLVLYGCETYSLTFTEKHKLTVCEFWA